MPTLKVAHIHEQGQDMIIAPLDSDFGYKSSSEQNSIINEIQMAASSAGLRGRVVVAWSKGNSMEFIAPPPWHPFFKGVSMQWIWANINREISW